jgi:hypothetical protein
MQFLATGKVVYAGRITSTWAYRREQVRTVRHSVRNRPRCRLTPGSDERYGFRRRRCEHYLSRYPSIAFCLPPGL